ncbi:MAG TPA: hypothetical protein PLN65_06475 [Enterococcus sp.]|nr:hypothetical protein [Enterococcus sp.]
MATKIDFTKAKKTVFSELLEEKENKVVAPKIKTTTFNISKDTYASFKIMIIKRGLSLQSFFSKMIDDIIKDELKADFKKIPLSKNPNDYQKVQIHDTSERLKSLKQYCFKIKINDTSFISLRNLITSVILSELEKYEKRTKK